MATIGPIRLRITVDSDSATSRVCVTYTVVFTQAEVAANTCFRERITLFGEDSPAGPAGDDPLFTFFPTRVVCPDGQAIRQRTVCQNVPNSVLDEDPGGLQDEIFARVCLTALRPPFPLQVCRNSNVVSI